jgi:hypothetical protein
MNTNINENTLRQMAYRIWESEGKPIGQADRHWEMALAQAGAQDQYFAQDEYLTGENFLGDAITSGDITPGDQAVILGDDREYAHLGEAAAESNTFGLDGGDSRQTENFPISRKTNKRSKNGSQENGSSNNSENSLSGKNKTGKKKPSDNILV